MPVELFTGFSRSPEVPVAGGLSVTVASGTGENTMESDAMSVGATTVT